MVCVILEWHLHGMCYIEILLPCEIKYGACVINILPCGVDVDYVKLPPLGLKIWSDPLVSPDGEVGQNFYRLVLSLQQLSFTTMSSSEAKLFIY